jgi:hypothetical protein
MKIEGEGESSNYLEGESSTHYYDFVPAKELFRWL